MTRPRIATPARVVLAASLLAVTCCQTPEPPPPPAPAPAPAPVATQAPAPRPVPVESDWIDRPQTPGDWSYTAEAGETLALFGPPGATRLVLACNPGTRQVSLVRPLSAARQGEVAMRISTETVSRPLMAKSVAGSPAQAPARAIATLDANDPLLDAMAITRGRFAVEVEGEQGLYVPAWAEVTRVIEDCR